MDNYYPIEIKLANKAGWSTPDEGRRLYGLYARQGVAVHWWGDGTGASNHDNIVNYILRKAVAGTGSANYVLSDNKITMLVSPDNVAWTTFSANAYTISIEFQPTLGAEGYKKGGWLIWQLRQRFGNLYLRGHRDLVGGTECPGSIDIGRLEAEAQKWASGGYNPPPTTVPTPTPAPEQANISYEKLPTPIGYVTNKQPTNVWDFNQTSWAGFGTPAKVLNNGEQFTAVAIATNHTLGSRYAVTQYSYERNLPVGVNIVDLSLPIETHIEPAPSPETVPEAQPLPDPVPTPGVDPQPDTTPLGTVSYDIGVTINPQTGHPIDNRPNWLVRLLQKLIDAIFKLLSNKKD